MQSEKEISCSSPFPNVCYLLRTKKEETFRLPRLHLLETIRYTTYYSHLTGSLLHEWRSETNRKNFEEVLNVLDKVPRHEFVPAELIGSAYQNAALVMFPGSEVAQDQYLYTISQPEMVALMTLRLDIPGLINNNGDDIVTFWEIGTGSGYQAAVLETFMTTYFPEKPFIIVTTEINPDLVEQSRHRLARLGYNRCRVVAVTPDLSMPFAHYAFDAIIVTAGLRRDTTDDRTKKAIFKLKSRLKIGGHLLLPYRSDINDNDILLRYRRNSSSNFSTEPLSSCSFVPFIYEASRS